MRAIIISTLLMVLIPISGGGQSAGLPVEITILYDNYPSHPSCRTDWGFSCLIKGLEKTILFDTGTDPDIFTANIRALGIDLDAVDLVVISHFHHDHDGGLETFLSQNTAVPVYVPKDPDVRAQSLLERVEKLGSSAVVADEPAEILPGVFLTGTLGDAIKEQALVIETGPGLVVITGCAHPGILSVLERAIRIKDRDIALVLGGFHLVNTPEIEVTRIIGRFRELGVRRVGASHCTGDAPLGMFRQSYGKDFVELGAGRILTVER